MLVHGEGRAARKIVGDSAEGRIVGGGVGQKGEAVGLAGGRGVWQVAGMDLTNYLRMDPHLLVGLVNTELRNHSDSLEDLVKTHNLDPEALEKRLGEAGYVYQVEQRQFR